MLTYFFGHPIYFARLRHVNPLCEHKHENLQRKESSDQKMQENKPVLELKNTKEKVCQKLKLKKNIFHCALLSSAQKGETIISFIEKISIDSNLTEHLNKHQSHHKFFQTIIIHQMYSLH